jgi:DNA-binding Lrp family transcriptional regulator
MAPTRPGPLPGRPAVPLPHGRAAPASPARPLDDSDWNIAAALSANGRATIAELAAAAGVSASTAHRRLNRLLTASTGLRLRCDLARAISGWPVSAWLFLRCPAAHRAATGRALGRLPEVRAVFSTAWPYNLIVALWLRSLADLENLETQLATKARHTEIVDRSVVIRPVKLMGRLLDPAGYATGAIPWDLRLPPVPAKPEPEQQMIKPPG